MRILITNDDGVHAEGLNVLERIARELTDDVTIVAPETDQSGVAHSLSLNDPLRLRHVGGSRYAVKGTPTDCVIMGVRRIMRDNPPDLILSGVNVGHNLAEDVTYSGTIAGAMEGTLLGVRSFALSQGYPPGQREEAPFACAQTHAPGLIRKLLAEDLDKGVLVNLNFPSCAPEKVQGVAVTVQGRRDATYLELDERFDGRHNPYYWIGFSRVKGTPPRGTDLAAIAENRISITPLRLDLTDEPSVTQLAARFS
jgi:5'-nucleotidase